MDMGKYSTIKRFKTHYHSDLFPSESIHTPGLIPHVDVLHLHKYSLPFAMTLLIELRCIQFPLIILELIHLPEGQQSLQHFTNLGLMGEWPETTPEK